MNLFYQENHIKDKIKMNNNVPDDGFPRLDDTQNAIEEQLRMFLILKMYVTWLN